MSALQGARFNDLIFFFLNSANQDFLPCLLLRKKKKTLRISRCGVCFFYATMLITCVFLLHLFCLAVFPRRKSRSEAELFVKQSEVFSIFFVLFLPQHQQLGWVDRGQRPRVM